MRFLGGAGAGPFYSLLLGQVRFFSRYFQGKSGLATEETVCSEPPKYINFFGQNLQRFLKIFWENAHGFLDKKSKKTAIVNRTSQYRVGVFNNRCFCSLFFELFVEHFPENFLEKMQNFLPKRSSLQWAGRQRAAAPKAIKQEGTCLPS